MSQMTLDCPSCGRPLLVPEAAVGRKARCTKCNTRFVIPSREELLEQTISHMVLEELDHRRHETEPAMSEAVSSAGRPTSRPDYPVSQQGTVLGMPAIQEDGDPDASGVLSVDDLSTPGDESRQTRGEPSLLDDDDNDSPRHREPPLNDESDSGHRESTATKEEATASSGSSAGKNYPQDLRPTKPRPYLVINSVSMEGVSLSFASEWLEEEVFRTSMPIRCIFTGKGPKNSLVSRPMIFLNRFEGVGEQARSLEMNYEQSLGPKHSPREHVRNIGRMSGISSPYDWPLLYYASAGHAGEAIKCRARNGEDGREHCELLIPFGDVAVEWVSRVNGRCGPEYAMIRGTVASLSNDGWSCLSEKCQRRLETWCRFERGERFKLYLNDADLTVADEGLGGVVVTDRRLLYHKFRRSRSLSLNQEAVLHLRTDDRYARITLESGGRLARAGKIHRHDMDKLIQSLADAPRLRVMVGHDSPKS